MKKKEDRNSAKASETAKGFLILIVLTSIIWFAIPDCSGTEEVDSTSQSDEKILAIEAYNFSHDLIKEYLKSPTTAVFPKPWDIKLVSLGDDRYFVDGYVDSQNGFGAMIRTEFECWIFYQRNVTVSIENIDFK